MNLTLKRLSLFAVALLCFGNISVNGQTVIYNGFGEYQFISGFPESDLHFYLFDDGYHSFEENPVHTYKSSAIPATPVLYHTQPYLGDDPDKIIFTGVNEGIITTAPPVYGFDNQIQLKRSWNMVEDQENYFLLMFENSIENENISGCIEFHYNKLDLEIIEANILDNYNNGWVDNRSVGTSEYSGYTDKFIWTYDDLKPGEQRFVYIPAKCLQDVFSKVPTRGIMKIDKCEDYIPDDGKTDGSNEGIYDGQMYTLESVVSNFPHDPNCIVTNPTCLGKDGAQTVNYKVYFQNDGVHPVEDVTIEIRFSGEIPLSDIYLKSASHDCALSWQHDRLFVHYEDIFMIGMGQAPEPTDIEETIGFVELEICFGNDVEFESNQILCFDSDGAIIFDSEDPIEISNSLCYDQLCVLSPDNISNECPSNPGIQSFEVLTHGAKVTNTNTIDADEEFRIIPNIASDYINIEGFENKEFIDVSIRSSILGLSKNFTIRSTEKIDINDLPQGIFYLSVHDGIDIKTKSFVKF